MAKMALIDSTFTKTLHSAIFWQLQLAVPSYACFNITTLAPALIFHISISSIIEGVDVTRGLIWHIWMKVSEADYNKEEAMSDSSDELLLHLSYESSSFDEMEEANVVMPYQFEPSDSDEEDFDKDSLDSEGSDNEDIEKKLHSLEM